MCKRNNDALFFTCSLIEQLGRSLHMRRGKVAAELGEAGIQTLYRNADILHCEPIEKVADDVITEFSLQGGDFDNLAEARYTVPDVWTMGKVYARLIEDVSDEDNIVETILQSLPPGSTVCFRTIMLPSIISPAIILRSATGRKRSWTVERNEKGDGFLSQHS